MAKELNSNEKKAKIIFIRRSWKEFRFQIKGQNIDNWVIIYPLVVGSAKSITSVDMLLVVVSGS